MRDHTGPLVSSFRHAWSTPDFLRAEIEHNALGQRWLKSDESWCAGTTLIAQRNITCPLTASIGTTTWQCIPTRTPPARMAQLAVERSAAPDERHLRGHHGHELDVRIV